MKNFSKIMLSVATVSALAASMAVSAMAADTITGTYNSTTGVVTIDPTTSGASQTLLVLNNDAATVTNSDIAQIDQKDDGTAFTEFVLPAGLTEGTYYVRVGGTDGTLQTGQFTISGSSVETQIIIVGDVDLKGTVVASDVTMLRRAVAGYSTGRGEVGTVFEKADGTGNVIVGDVDLKGTVVASDVTMLRRAVAGYSTGKGEVGTEVEVIKQ